MDVNPCLNPLLPSFLGGTLPYGRVTLYRLMSKSSRAGDATASPPFGSRSLPRLHSRKVVLWQASRFFPRSTPTISCPRLALPHFTVHSKKGGTALRTSLPIDRLDWDGIVLAPCLLVLPDASHQFSAARVCSFCLCSDGDDVVARIVAKGRTVAPHGVHDYSESSRNSHAGVLLGTAVCNS